MKKFLLLLALFIVTINLQAQNYNAGSITLNSGEKLDGRVFLDQNQKLAVLKKGDSYSFMNIESVRMGDREYRPVSINGSGMLLSSLTEGKATLYHAGGKIYTISIANGTAQTIDTNNNRNQVRGRLLVLFTDCNQLREMLNDVDDFSERNLLRFTNTYNNCEYGSYQPTEKELYQANRNNTDLSKFYAGAGLSLNSVSFFDSSETESLTGGRWVVGVAVSPSFLGSIQGNLHFSLEASGSYSGSQDFSNAPDPVDLQINSHQFLLGLEYYFNKDGGVEPFVGIGAGVAADRFKGMAMGLPFKISGGNVVYSPRAGMIFKLNNGKHVGIIVNFIPEYQNDLSFPVENNTEYKLEVNSQYLNFGAIYIF